MNAAIAMLPTRAVVDAKWETYAALMRPLIDNPELVLDRDLRERAVLAENEWKEAFTSWLSRSA